MKAITSYSELRYIKADVKTAIEDIKKQYIKLVMANHPDHGGDEDTMKRINVEWDFCRKHNYNVHANKDGGTYTNEQQDAPDDVTDAFADIISQLVNMDGLEIEICGSWLWVGGNTKDHKDSLKEMGMRWASKKHRWYKAPKDWKRKVRCFEFPGSTGVGPRHG